MDRPPDGVVNCVIADKLDNAKPREGDIRSLTMDTNDLLSWREQVRQVWDRGKWKAEVQTKYKSVGRKIKPMNVPLASGESPGGKSLSFGKRESSAEGETEAEEDRKATERHGGKTVPRGS